MRERGENVSSVCTSYLSTNFSVENSWQLNFRVILSNIDWFIVLCEISSENSYYKFGIDFVEEPCYFFFWIACNARRELEAADVCE